MIGIILGLIGGLIMVAIWHYPGVAIPVLAGLAGAWAIIWHYLDAQRERTELQAEVSRLRQIVSNLTDEEQ